MIKLSDKGMSKAQVSQKLDLLCQLAKFWIQRKRLGFFGVNIALNSLFIYLYFFLTFILSSGVHVQVCYTGKLLSWGFVV